MSQTFERCRNCQNTKRGDDVYECSKCGKRFCSNCGDDRLRDVCPGCGTAGRRIGEIEG
jgi:hypothetical protein